MSFVLVFCVPGNYFLLGAHRWSSGICFQRLDQRPAVFLYKQQHQSIQGWHWFAKPHRLHPGICKFKFGLFSSWKPSQKDDPKEHPPGFCICQLKTTSDFSAWFLVYFLVHLLFSDLLYDFYGLYPKWKCLIFTYFNFYWEDHKRKLLSKKVPITVALSCWHLKNIVRL